MQFGTWYQRGTNYGMVFLSQLSSMLQDEIVMPYDGTFSGVNILLILGDTIFGRNSEHKHGVVFPVVSQHGRQLFP